MRGRFSILILYLVMDGSAAYCFSVAVEGHATLGSIREGHLKALAALAIGLVALLLGWNGWTTYQATLDNVRTRANDLAQVAERHALQIVTEARGLMEVVELGVGHHNAGEWSEDWELWASLRALTSAAENIDGLIVVDSTGTLALWSNKFPAPKISIANGGDFEAAMTTDGIVVGALRIGSLTNRPIFIIGRRLRSGEGAVFVSVDAAAVARAYSASGLTADNRFGLYRSDGAVLATHPFNADTPAQNAVTTGELSLGSDGRLQANEDALGRIASLRPLHGAPIVALAAADPEADIALWRTGILSRILIGAIAAALIVAFTRLAVAQIRREREARTALSSLNRRLEAVVAERTEKLTQVAEEQRRAKALAEAATQAKSRFLTAVGHDLRQPLQALRLYQQSLALKIHEPGSERLLGQMSEAISASEGLLSSIMEIGRIEAGQVLITPSALPFADLAATLEAQAGTGRLRVVPCRAILHADRVVLGRILGNLVANAIRHGRGGRVLLGCRRDPDNGLRLVVCDQGSGIPADKLDAIFEEFYQLDNASRSRDKGFGLGLSIARRLAAASGFSMSVTSTPRGSTFAVHLPAHAVQSWPAAAVRNSQAN